MFYARFKGKNKAEEQMVHSIMEHMIFGEITCFNVTINIHSWEFETLLSDFKQQNLSALRNGVILGS